MNILLIDPSKSHAEGGTEPYGKQTPHIGLTYLGTYLKKLNYNIEILDFSIQDSIDIIDYIKKFKPDYVGITAMSFQIHDVYDLFRKIKGYDKNIKTVIGGSHVTAIPEKVMGECGDIDYAITGEGESIFHKLIENGFKERSVLHSPVPIDLNTLDFPDWSLFDYSKYAKSFSFKFDKDLNIYPVSTTRGCPYKCIFCHGDYLGKKVRMRSPENIVEEIEHDIEKYDSGFFYIADSNVTINMKRFISFCKMLIEKKLNEKISWKAQSRINLLDENALKMMKEAGCETLFMGIESGDDETLKIIDKQITTKMIRKIVKAANRIGLRVRASFVIGLPFETEERIMNTINFAKELDLDSFSFHILDIYPKTRIYEYVEKNYGGLKYANPEYRNNWMVLNRNKAMVEVGNLSEERINEL